ncbi:acyltransferase [Rhizobium sp. 18055]|uniref:acyltransferase family protein n=1 Tax=Rhizobium sp. 18055 TaxID=2681403 RepID=UPI00135C76CE|nr:acyltransferase [Rhizobium sp. 18055]
MASNRSTFSQMLQAADGRPSGFDYMRIGLAVAITLYHSVRVTFGTEVDHELWQTLLRGPLRSVLPMFFVLSGFLVAGSLVRCRTLVSFLGLRAIRIYPALIGEVLLSALIIGPFFTDLPLLQYFTDPQFFRYLANVTGHISYWLPGVFAHNPDATVVNAQLWTVPFELYCYLLLSGLTLLGLKKQRWIGLVALGALIVGYVVFRQFKPDPLAGLANLSGWELMLYFLGGVCAYQFRDRIPAGPLLFCLSVALSFVLLQTVPGGEYLAIPPVVYMTIYLGLTNYQQTIFSKLSDFSYGLFLYHWTIQQCLVALLPQAKSALLTAFVGLIGGLAIAWVSWTFIERPALSSKRRVLDLEDLFLAAGQRAHRAVCHLQERIMGTATSVSGKDHR